MTTIRFINSVDEHVADTEVDLPDELADAFIIKGYAEGELSRLYDENEINAIRAEIQVVNA